MFPPAVLYVLGTAKKMSGEKSRKLSLNAKKS
jgi:hypothetical protein